ncbi:MAG: helix-turn-helix domain-containing protein [Thermoanaerobaculia bacterium]
MSVALTVLRVIRGWTQEDLAQASGVRASSVSDYERGKKVPELKTLQRLVSAMGYPLAALDHTQTFIYGLRSESVLLGRPAHHPSLSHFTEQDSKRLSTGAVAGEGNSAALEWELEQVSVEAGRVVSRMTRLLFTLVSRTPSADPPPQDTQAG